MANRYTKSTDAQKKMLQEVVDKYHKDLNANGVTIDLLFGYAPRNDDDEPTGPALKKHGLPTLAVTSVTPLKNRVRGLADAEIVIDGDQWETMTDEEKIALLDRAVEGIEISRDIDGNVIYDTHGRPKLKLKQPDWVIMLYNAVAMRHGRNSQEVRQLKEFGAACSTMYFPFMKELELDEFAADPEDQL